jgi:hypothetical protein
MAESENPTPPQFLVSKTTWISNHKLFPLN